MKKLSLFLSICLCVITLSRPLLARTASPLHPDRSYTYKIVHNLPLHLYIFYPKSKATHSAIVFFHGGGWMRGKPRQFFRQASYLAAHGMLAVSVEYRTKTLDGSTPKEALMDAKSAMRWVRAHAKELEIDPHRIAASGGSAGGQLAADTALNTTINDPEDNLSVSPKPNALILFNPVIDNGPGGYGYRRVKGYWREFSPMELIRAPMPPTLIMIGDHDHLIPLSTIEEFAHKIRETGARCDLYVFERANHGFFNHAEYRAEIRKILYSFLKSIGYIE